MHVDIKITEKEKGIFVISPSGAIDSDTYFVFEKEVDSVLAKKPKTVVVDMKEVNYISSAGLGVIFKAKKSLKQAGSNLCIVNLTPSLKKVFDIINALPPQDIFASVEELDNYLDRMQREDS